MVYKNCISQGLLAQLVEQLTLNQLVEGSSPSQPTSKFKELAFHRLTPFFVFYDRTYLLWTTAVKVKLWTVSPAKPEVYQIKSLHHYHFPHSSSWPSVTQRTAPCSLVIQTEIFLSRQRARLAADGKYACRYPVPAETAISLG
jgi:hypothetical protein